MKYNLTAAIAIVIANMIGTGVLTSLGFQLVDLNNLYSILTLWMVGGVIALLGSFCYAEMSAAFPRSGGEYHFLRLSFGNAVGFLSGWTSAIVGFAAPIAAAAFAFSNYFGRIVNLPVSGTLISVILVICISIIHSLKVHLGAKIQVFFTAGKILLLLFFIIAGLLSSVNNATIHQELTTNFVAADFLSPAFWIGLIFVSYAYSGWNASAYIIDDIEKPVKNVPRSILIGTITVIVIYVLLNFVFLMSAPASAMKGKPEVAHVVASYIFGDTGATIISAMISFFLVSTIGSMIIVGPRVLKRMANDYTEFSFFAKDNRNGVPIRAIVLQAFIAILLLLTSSFEFIITAIGFILSLFTTLTALALIWTRVKHPEIARPIKVPLYPLTPILFILFNCWTMYFLLQQKNNVFWAGIAFVLIGCLVYLFITQRKKMMRLPILLILIAALGSCNEGADKKDAVAVGNKENVLRPRTNEQVAFIVDTALDNRATELSGLNASLYQDKSTITSARNLNSSWEEKNSQILNPIKSWLKKERLNHDTTQPTMVFYPFSGPDFEFANTFYPEADVYVLCGLEKAGNDSSLIFYRNSKADEFIKSAESYFYFSDRLGFFRTKDMAVQFEKRGVADILSLYIKRTGAKLGSASLQYWNKTDGKLVMPNKEHQPNACMYTFCYPSGKKSTLYYFSKDLSDGSLKNDSLWLHWVQTIGANHKIVSLAKSASYLMHLSSFSIVKQFILANSYQHIQDDTGIPYKDMMQTGKQISLYGTYTHVIPMFKAYLQNDLVEKYKQLTPPLLPFRIGYNLSHQEACLQVLK